MSAETPVTDAARNAAERVSIGPAPSWVLPVAPLPTVRGRPGEPASYLLLMRQHHAELQQIHCRTVVRLDTIEAVRELSQFRLNFDPLTERVVLHRIEVRRGEHAVNYATSERLRVLQREEGLDRLVLTGLFTVLVLAEDVRPGDILDTCFTIERKPHFLAANAFGVFELPVHPVGQFHFSVRFSRERPLRWKAHLPDLKPVQTEVDGDLVCTWSGENHNPPQYEPNTPPWHRSYPWMQFSDCDDWATVSSALYRAWQERMDGESESVNELLNSITRQETDPLRRISRVLDVVQDEHRYLSVATDRGGGIPACPDSVARRRYGDCKDLAWLAVTLLTHLGVTARPVLVHTVLGNTLREMLPDAYIFNHAILQFEWNGERRWVDLTINRQGGGALNRVIPDYRAGLLLDPEKGGIVSAPPASVNPGVYEYKETILLDTTGAASVLALTITATRDHADRERRRFATTPLDEIRQQELQRCINRFNKAQWVGELEYRDDREQNEFTMAAMFEVNGFLSQSAQPGFCWVPVPQNPALSLLPIPERTSEDEPRRWPFVLSHPWRIRHVVEFESPALQQIPFKSFSLDGSFVQFRRTHRNLYRHWSITFEFSTVTDLVPAEEIGEYVKTVETIWRESLLQVSVPVGYAHPRRRDDFGRLPFVPVRNQDGVNVATASGAMPPDTWKPASVKEDGASGVGSLGTSTVTSASPDAKSQTRDVTVASRSQPRSHSSRRRRIRHMTGATKFAIACVALLALFCAFVVFLTFRYR